MKILTFVGLSERPSMPVEEYSSNCSFDRSDQSHLIKEVRFFFFCRFFLSIERDELVYTGYKL